MPGKKKTGQKGKRRGEEKKREVKVEFALLLMSKPKQARTLEANKLHLEQKAPKLCSTYKRFGQFFPFTARH